jgi:NADH-quinone oxidoreductase subunit G
MTDTQPDTDVITITVDGQEMPARKGELVIAVAERHGVFIPRFCYHPRMRSVGMCRMCIVDIDTGRGPALLPSCMVECSDGMTVVTDSPGAKKAQEGVLEFLLINHPLDCPVCDKGGECPLQDQTMSFGPGESRFLEEKRHFEKPIPVSDLVLLDRERCILCDRCTRFADEVAGDPLIRFMGRGNETQINTFPDHPFASYFSGNTVQICPVGALTATTYRFKARPWDLEMAESTCTTCSFGCRVVVESSRNQVVRYEGVDVDEVNWGWLCDKGRFDFEAVGSDERLGSPLLREEGLLLEPTSWADALSRASTALRDGIERGGPEGVAVLGGARLTNEDAYAWVKLAKGVIGTDSVDCQLADGLSPEVLFGLPRAAIDEACQPGGVVLLLAPDPKEEVPVFYLRLRDAVVNGGVTVIELAPTLTGTSSLAAHSLRYRPGELAPLVDALLAGSTEKPEVAGVRADIIENLGQLLSPESEAPLTVVVGRPNLAETATSVIAASKAIHAVRPEARFLSALRRGNVHGALDMGMTPGLLPGWVTYDDENGRERLVQRWPRLPMEPGQDARGILRAAAEGRIDTLIVLGADPVCDFPDRALAERALAGARTVVACDLFLTESVRQADVVLPVAGYAEVDGTTTNLEGRVTNVVQKVTPPGTARSDWMIAAELARRLGYDLGLESTEQIWNELAEVIPAYAAVAGTALDVGVAGGGSVLLSLPGKAQHTGESTAPPDDATYEEGPTDAVPGGVALPDEAARRRIAGLATPGASDAAALEASREPPGIDAYSLRLISMRRLYDRGTGVRHSPGIAGLAEPAVLRLNPYDFNKLGISPGTQMRAVSAVGQLIVPIQPDERVTRGAAELPFNQGGGRANVLIDSNSVVTDIRIERT